MRTKPSIPMAQVSDRTKLASLLASRRMFIVGLSAILAACTQTVGQQLEAPAPDPKYVSMYSAVPDERFPLPATDVRRIDPRYFRQRVRYQTAEPIGTIVVNPAEKFLYLVMEGGYAMRYGIGVGRQGFGWSGAATIERKAQWPTWTPTADMIEREPRYAQYAKGMEPGLDNPLGARALYLYQGGQDTLYRLHGTNEPRSIGQAVSSGCIRLFNQDIIDLYRRTPVGTRVVVLGREYTA